jgi:hypothetical protein
MIFVFPPRGGARETWRDWLGWRAVILSSTSSVTFEDENAGGSHDAAEAGFDPPFDPGLWVWRGEIRYPDPDLEEDTGPAFVGEWRRPTTDELVELAGPVGRAPSIRPAGAP